MLTRRQALKSLMVPLLVPIRSSLAGSFDLGLHNTQGNQLLNNVLQNPNYWSSTDASRYTGEHYDEIRLSSGADGYLAYISGEGKQSFTARDVAETIFQHQDLIPRFMPSLISAKYIGEGVAPYNNRPYTDIYFLVDLKILYMSVPLRTYLIEQDDGTYICAIELITEKMTTPKQWTNYQNIIAREKEKIGDLWFFQSIVPVEYVYGFYHITPGTTHESRVTLVTQVKFSSNDSILASIATELPFVLRQGMQAGFNGSVAACRVYRELREQNRNTSLKP